MLHVIKTGSFQVLRRGLFVLLTFFSCFGALAEVSVQATIDRNVLSLNDTLILTITASSSDSLTLDRPQLPPLQGFTVVKSWESSSSQSTFTNGAFTVEQKKIFSFMLSPQKEGQLKIGSAKVNIRGQVFNTQSLNVEVLPEDSPKLQQAGPPGGQQGQPIDPFAADEDDILSQLLQRNFGVPRGRRGGGSRTLPTNPKESFFIQVDVDKKQVYVGEQITVSFYLYTRGQIRDIDTLKYPSLAGFWKEDIFLATRLDFKQEVIEGVPWQKAMLASYALFPIKKGKAKVDAYKARCTVVSGGRFGFGRAYKFTKSSKPIQIEVLEVPAEGRPPEFAGAVGDFNVTAELDQKSVPVNQPMTLKLRFTGRGNAKLIELPPLGLPESMEIYDTKTESRFNPDGTSFKDFEVLLIPRDQGEFQIPELTFAVFHPERKAFEIKKTLPIDFQVLPGKGENSISSSPLKRKKEKGASLPELDSSPLESQANLVGPIGVWSTLYGLLFAGLSLYAWGQLRLKRKKKDLKKELSKKIQRMNQLRSSENWREFGVEGVNYFPDLLGELSGAAGGYAEIVKILNQCSPQIRRECGEKIQKLTKKFEILGFAPEGLVGELKSKARMGEMVKELEQLARQAIQLSGKSSSSDSSE